MKKLLSLEELMIFILSIYLFSQLAYPWWVFPVFLFLPDLGMLGYVKDTSLGATLYNIVHHRGLHLVIYFLGIFLKSDLIMLIGIICFAHSSLDRVLNYGLKYKDDFKHTHLS